MTGSVNWTWALLIVTWLIGLPALIATLSDRGRVLRMVRRPFFLVAIGILFPLLAVGLFFPNTKLATAAMILLFIWIGVVTFIGIYRQHRRAPLPE